jgi:hypothetical protein
MLVFTMNAWVDACCTWPRVLALSGPPCLHYLWCDIVDASVGSAAETCELWLDTGNSNPDMCPGHYFSLSAGMCVHQPILRCVVGVQLQLFGVK